MWGVFPDQVAHVRLIARAGLRGADARIVDAINEVDLHAEFSHRARVPVMGDKTTLP